MTSAKPSFLVKGLYFFRNITDNFGLPFAVVLMSVYFGLIGTTLQILLNSYLPYFKSVGATGTQYQALVTVATMPWATKAAIGLLSDAVPIFGYHKRGYIVVMSVVGTLALLLLGLIPLGPSLGFIGAILLFVVNLQAATVDLLTEGKYAELMVARPETGSDIVSFAWGLKCTGAFVGCIISGIMTTLFAPRFMYIVAMPLAAQVMLPAIFGLFPERRLPPSERRIRYDKLNAYPDLFKLSIVMTTGAIIVAMSAFGPSTLQSSVSLGVAVILATLGFIWLPKPLRPANLYLFLNNLIYISITGATDYWYTADQSCVPGGPSFSMSYYVSFANLIGSIASVAGVIVFQTHFSRGKFRTAFAAALFIKIFASVFDLVLVTRYNRHIGIPDKVFFAMGDAVIYQVITRIEVMPAIVLTSKVCPRGMEASVYALLVSFQNLGQGVARTVGDGLLDLLNIRTVAPCNFDNLPLAIIIAHVALPLLIFPLIFVLIPDARMTDDLINILDPSSSESSPVRANGITEIE